MFHKYKWHSGITNEEKTKNTKVRGKSYLQVVHSRQGSQQVQVHQVGRQVQ